MGSHVRLIRAIPLLVAALAPGVAVRAADAPAQRVYERIRNSTVKVEDAVSHGSGVVWHRDGLILTNLHVVALGLPLTVTVALADSRGRVERQRLSDVELLGTHPRYDMALLKVTVPAGKRLVAARMASAAPARGAPVFAIGYPGGDAWVLKNIVTAGTLAHPARRYEDLTYLQISAAVNPGNSGGPLCDQAGRVIGLNTFKLTAGERLNFAVPVTSALRPSDFVPLARRMVDEAAVSAAAAPATDTFLRSIRAEPRRLPAEELRAAGSLYMQLITDWPTNGSFIYRAAVLSVALRRATAVLPGTTRRVPASYLLCLRAVELGAGEDVAAACAALGNYELQIFSDLPAGKKGSAEKRWQVGVEHGGWGAYRCAAFLSELHTKRGDRQRAAHWAIEAVRLAEDTPLFVSPEKVRELDRERQQLVGQLSPEQRAQLQAHPAHVPAPPEEDAPAPQALNLKQVKRARWGSANLPPLPRVRLRTIPAAFQGMPVYRAEVRKHKLPEKITALAVSHDGKALYVASGWDWLTIHDPVSLEEQARLQLPQHAKALAPIGQYLLAFCPNSRVIVLVDPDVPRIVKVFPAIGVPENGPQPTAPRNMTYETMQACYDRPAFMLGCSQGLVRVGLKSGRFEYQSALPPTLNRGLDKIPLVDRAAYVHAFRAQGGVEQHTHMSRWFSRELMRNASSRGSASLIAFLRSRPDGPWLALFREETLVLDNSLKRTLRVLPFGTLFAPQDAKVVIVRHLQERRLLALVSIESGDVLRVLYDEDREFRERLPFIGAFNRATETLYFDTSVGLLSGIRLGPVK